MALPTWAPHPSPSAGCRWPASQGVPAPHLRLHSAPAPDTHRCCACWAWQAVPADDLAPVQGITGRHRARPCPPSAWHFPPHRFRAHRPFVESRARTWCRQSTAPCHAHPHFFSGSREPSMGADRAAHFMSAGLTRPTAALARAGAGCQNSVSPALHPGQWSSCIPRLAPAGARQASPGQQAYTAAASCLTVGRLARWWASPATGP